MLLLAMALLLPTSLRAEVVATFYSHDLGSTFPHTFFTLKGTTDSGEAVDTNHGFTTVAVTPAVLFGSVHGKMELSKASYVESSDPRFSVRLTNDQYRALLAYVDEWSRHDQPSYNLNRRNCIHFVAGALQVLGITYNERTKNWKKPKSFLLEVMALNPGLSLETPATAGPPPTVTTD